MNHSETVDPQLGMSRRTLLRRGAVVGGSLMWAAPAVQSFARPAFAGTPECVARVRVEANGVCIETRYEEDQDCCDCLEEQQNAGVEAFVAALNCFTAGRCAFDGGQTHLC